MKMGRTLMAVLLARSLMGSAAQAADQPTSALVEKILAGIKGRPRKGAESPFVLVTQQAMSGPIPMGLSL